MSNLKKERDLAVWTNRLIISSLLMGKSYQRDFKLNYSNVIFEVDSKVRDEFKNYKINEERLKAFIQNNFQQPKSDFDYLNFGYFRMKGITLVWQITFVCKKSGQAVKPIYFQDSSQANFFDYKVTILREQEFNKTNDLGEVDE
ncbi:hypothetical protein [Thalassotalea sp. SU-HH00458]|uniref:hypothetical protein n=1 Tax=Thalassotalea sp. SU-HH00458 TaxID=3127657 RepID=UPI003103EFFC